MFNAATTASQFRVVEAVDTFDLSVNSTLLLENIISFTATLEQRIVFQAASVYNLTLRYEKVETADFDLTVTVNVSSAILVGNQEIEIKTGQVNAVTQPTIEGGRPPLEFSLKAGTLPSGMTLNSSTGAIEGSATQVTAHWEGYDLNTVLDWRVSWHNCCHL